MAGRIMMSLRTARIVFVLLNALGLLSCTSWRAEYLGEAMGRANQDAVIMKLGPPMGERMLTNGDAVWVYRYTGASVGQSGGGTWCQEYVLRFDSQKILREWNRQKC